MIGASRSEHLPMPPGDSPRSRSLRAPGISGDAARTAWNEPPTRRRHTPWKMSEETVEIVRRVHEAFNARDLRTLLELVAPDIEWRPALFGGGIVEGAGSSSGRSASRRRWVGRAAWGSSGPRGT